MKMLVINPGPKKRRRRRGKMPAGLKAYMARKRRKNPRGKRRARRNPRLSQLFSKQNLKTHVLDPAIAAGIGGAAAVALDVGIAYLPFGLADKVKGNVLASTALKLAGAIALGVGAAKVLGKERGRLVTTGAMTVAAYGAIRDGIKQFAPDTAAKVKGLGGIADFIDYDVTPARSMGALQYSGAPLRGGLGLIEAQSQPSLGGTFDPAFDNAFSGLDD